MRHAVPLAVKIHRWLIRALIPSLGPDLATEANSAFHDLYTDNHNGSFLGRARLWQREIRSLLATAFFEIRPTGPRSPRPATRRSGSSGRSQLGKPPNRLGFGGVLDHIRRDLRYAVRSLSREPTFLAVSVLSLGFGIALATSVFSVVNAALLRPAPHVYRPEQLVRLYASFSPDEIYGPFSHPDLADIRERTPTLADVAAFQSVGLTLTTESNAFSRVSGLAVSENYFELLGVRMPLGRGFIPDDATPGKLVAVIGHGLWQRHFGGDPAVLGQWIRLNGRQHTIVGVAPEGLLAHNEPIPLDVWLPIAEPIRDERGYLGLSLMGRMADGVTERHVQAQLDLVAERLLEEFPDYWTNYTGEPRRMTVLSNRAAGITPDQRAQVATTFGALAVVIALVLLISCSNVANLLLTRAWRRRTEIAVKLALGASRRRLVGQLLAESLVLAALAGGLGLLVIHWISGLLASGRFPIAVPTPIDATVDWRVATFAVVLTVVTGIAFGMVPALKASRPDLVPALKGLDVGTRFGRFSIRNLLVVAQVAGSLVLVLTATLLLRSLQKAQQVDIGFDPENIAVVSVNLGHRQYDETAAAQFYDELMQRLQSLPQVEGAALARRVPLEGGSMRHGGVEPEGYELGPDEYLVISYNIVSPGYFELIRMPLVRGREFRETDAEGSTPVVMVNEAFANRFWPGEDPIGKRVKLDESAEVIGLVHDAKYTSITEGGTPFVWAPSSQNPQLSMRVHIRTRGDARALLQLARQEIHALDADLPIVESRLMTSLTRNAVLPYQIVSAVLGVASLVALALAMMGIYGVMAFAVSQRTREVGIRVALGAKPGRVVQLIVREGVALAGFGVVAGFPVVLVLAQLMKAFLVGVRPFDPLSLGVGTALLALAAAGATMVPAIRAAKVDPMVSLRAE
ncbi:MAG: ABC transporter permease [Gemmatimonadota bacterium]|nr:MAG: ABC transporter permease [Gemmatimonadota bacterium]